MLDAYTAGINAFIARGAAGPARSLEHRLLRFAPAPWTTEDSLAVGRLIAFSISPNWASELVRARLVTLFGRDAAAALEPGVWAADDTSVWSEDGSAMWDVPAGEAPGPIEMPGGAGGSNNWVVDGSRSRTGRPLLANDIHLFPQLPSIVYEAHLATSSGLEVAGATIPGVAGVVIGHNADITWGVTASLADVQDLFIERIDPGSPSRTRVADGWHEGEVLSEEIEVKGRSKPWLEEVLVTSHGPVIAPTPALAGVRAPLALQSTVLEARATLAPLLDLNRARNWEEFRDALRTWATPSLSFVYADATGNIGFQAAGVVPVRAGGAGVVPSPGWTGTHDWVGELAFDEMPHAFNPGAGAWATANHDIAASTGHPLGREYASPARYLRIRELLDATEKHSVASFVTIQSDDRNEPAKAAAGILGERLPPSDALRRAVLERLRSWDGHMTEGSLEASVYAVFMDELVRTRHAGETTEGAGLLLGHGPHPTLAPAWSHYFVRGEETLSYLRDWAAEDGSRPDGPVEVAFVRTLEVLSNRLGPNPARWSWERLHTLTLRHPLGARKPLERLLNVGGHPVPGNMDTVRVSASLPGTHEVQGPISAYRFVADVSDWDASLSCLPGGQSGHRASPHYADQLRDWHAMGYHRLAFSAEAVAGAAEERMLLRPTGRFRVGGRLGAPRWVRWAPRWTATDATTQWTQRNSDDPDIEDAPRTLRPHGSRGWGRR